MDDAPTLPPAPVLPPVNTTRAALFQIGRQVRYGTTLTPWMRAYAEWLMLECAEPPKLVLRASRARGLSRASVNQDHLRLLEARPDFLAYCDDLRAGPLEAARAKFASRFPEYIDAHHAALGAARDANDYTAMAKIAEPVLDRVYPKRSENVAATQVNITLSPEQIAGVRAYTAPVLTVDVPTPATANDSADAT